LGIVAKWFELIFMLLFGIVLAGGDKTTALFGSGMRSQSDPFFDRFLQGLS
jgi:hypothetical protein